MSAKNEFENFGLAVQNGHVVDKDGFSEDLLPQMRNLYEQRARLPRTQARHQTANLQTLFDESSASEQAKLAQRIQTILAGWGK